MRTLLAFLFLLCCAQARAQADTAFCRNDTLFWKSTVKNKPSQFHVEYFLGDKWRKICSREPVYMKKKGWYAMEVFPHSEGKNKFRIENAGNYKEVEVTAVEKHSLELNFKISKYVNLCAELKYVIFDKMGNKVKEGTACRIDCSDLLSDVYYISFPEFNESLEFFKL